VHGFVMITCWGVFKREDIGAHINRHYFKNWLGRRTSGKVKDQIKVVGNRGQQQTLVTSQHKKGLIHHSGTIKAIKLANLLMMCYLPS